jgi:hypothetical protein
MTSEVEYNYDYYTFERTTFLGVYKNPKTYTSLVYLLLTFPLGIAFFVYAVTGFSVSIGFVFTVVGIFLLYIFLWSLPRIMYIMGLLTDWLVGIKMPEKVYKPYYEGSLFKKALKSLGDSRIWKTFLYFLFPAMPFGIAAFTIVVTLLSVSLGAISFPIVYLVELLLGNYNDWIYFVFDYWAPPWVKFVLLILVPIVGFFLLTATLHLTNTLALAHGRMVKGILRR